MNGQVCLATVNWDKSIRELTLISIPEQVCQKWSAVGSHGNPSSLTERLISSSKLYKDVIYYAYCRFLGQYFASFLPAVNNESAKC